ncbi:CUE domain-containing protein 3 [Madurella mycetomatis]|uniref:CUE domain-containing protein 3 n=1 Tax=Madurella mycetomatis TaxID=100816 RepID=A0A175W103_9PEZI|nr:CUE domain-containing protein 3 [Madurella mycetomatis]
MASSRLPAFALFPIAAWRGQLVSEEWVACLNAWLALVDSHLSLSDEDFLAISTKDQSLLAFLTSFIREAALGGVSILGPSLSAKRLPKVCFSLVTRLLHSSSPPSGLAQWGFLADLSRVYGKRKAEVLLSVLPGVSRGYMDASLAGLKKFLIKNLDAGLDGGDLKGIEEQLERVNDLIRASPSVAEFFLAGSDFLDGLVNCYKLTNPPLRKALVATTYLCLVGLAEGQKLSALTDQLYSLKAAAAAHKSGPLNVNDSLVAELVTSTPILQRIRRTLDQSGGSSSRTKSVLTELGTFKKPGGSLSKPKRLIKRKIDKGKGLAEYDEAQVQQEMHIHRTSQISQVQDLFPELGSGFIAKLLDEYSDNPEQVVSHLLDGSLPPHLASADRSEELSHPSTTTPAQPRHSQLPARLLQSTPQDSDASDLDMLTAPTARLHIGKAGGAHATADALLSAPTSATHKAAILSALATFDADDDERDDTYDAADVGGTVDTSTPALERPAPGQGQDQQQTGLAEGAEAALFAAWQADPGLFGRDAATRKGAERERLRQTAGMTDEAVEGWAVMLGRDAAMRKRLEGRYGEGAWRGEQTLLEGTRGAWRAELDTEGEGEGEGSDSAAGRGGYRRGGAGRGRGGRGGRGRGRGGNAPPADSKLARRRKEENKGSRAREGRARKMARGGFAG